jgi:hypothetical protein
MGRAYRRFVAEEKKEIGDDLLDFQNTIQIVIPARLNDRLLLDDVVDGQRMLVFASEFGRQLLLTHGANVSIDGTFKASAFFLCRIISVY